MGNKGIGLPIIMNQLRLGISKRQLIYLMAFIIRIPLLALFGDYWDTYVFTRVVRDWYMSGMTPYDVAIEDPPWIYLPLAPYTQNWYAYPPLPFVMLIIFYSPCVIFQCGNPLLERFFIKLPMALGDLLLAHASRLYLEKIKSGSTANRMEKFILFNPFVILISSVWGMFDSIVLALMILSLYYLEEKSVVKAGVFYALSIGFKQTAAFVFPLILIYVLKNKDKRRFARYILAFVLTSALIFVPFAFDNFNGLLKQVLLIHLKRPLQGFSVTALSYFFLKYVGVRFIALFYPSIIFDENAFKLLSSSVDAVGSIVLTAFTLTVLFLLTYIIIRWIIEKKSEINTLNRGIAIVFTVFVLLNKVANEQYFLYAFVFLYMYYLTTNNKENVLKRLRKASYSFTVASALYACRFSLFIPYDVAKSVNSELSWYLYFHVSPLGVNTPIKIVFTAVSYLLIIYILLVLITILNTEIKELQKSLNTHRGTPKPVIKIIHILKKLTLKKVATFIIIISILVGVLSYTPIPSANTSERVIAFYYTWFINPTHDPTIKAGYWEKTVLTPIEGYYDSTWKYIEEDFKQIKEIGGNAIIFDFSPINVQFQFITELVSKIALENNLNFALSFNVKKLFEDTSKEKNNFTILDIKNLLESITTMDIELQLSSMMIKQSYLRINESYPVFITGLDEVSQNVSNNSELWLAIKDFVSKLSRFPNIVTVFIVENYDFAVALLKECSDQKISIAFSPDKFLDADDYSKKVESVYNLSSTLGVDFIPLVTAKYTGNREETILRYRIITNMIKEKLGTEKIIFMGWNNYVENEVIEPTVELGGALVNITRTMLYN